MDKQRGNRRANSRREGQEASAKGRKPLEATSQQNGEQQAGERSKSPSSGRAVGDFFSSSEIFQRVVATAEDELNKPLSLLFWSGLAAGLALGLTFLARVIFTSLTPGDPSGLLGNILYPIGFVVIVLGRYQLFTENTLTPLTLVMSRFATLPDLFKLWGTVFVANMIGAVLISALLAFTGVLEPSARETAVKLGEESLKVTWGAIFFRSVIAGWLVASMVWLVHSARDTISRLFLIWIIMYFVGAAHFFHVITSSVEIFFYAFDGHVDSLAFIPEFVVPVLLGNIVGGVVFVAILNYAQVGEKPFEAYEERLPWKAWLLSQRPSEEREA